MDHSKMKIYKVELEEGDSLMIPPWWWHAVEGIGLNCSITKTYERSDYSYVYDKPNLAFVMIVAAFLDFFEDSFEIIVVDNLSTDDSAEDAKRNFPSIVLLKSEKNLGYSGGCNLGAKNAVGEYVIFLNNDTIHTKNWIEELINFLDKNPNDGAAQPKI